MLNPFGEVKKQVDEQVKRAHDIGFDRGFKAGYDYAFQLGCDIERSKHVGVITGLNPKFKSVEELMGGNCEQRD